MWFVAVLYWIGALTVAVVVGKFYQFLWFYTNPKSIERFQHARKEDGAKPWALITGSASGIGLSYAHSLASHGFNLVLHDRTQAQLATIKQDLLLLYPTIEIRLLVLDAYRTGVEFHRDIEGIAKSIQDLHVTLLINNLGTAEKKSGGTNNGSDYGLFVDEVPSDIDALLALNIGFTLHLTRAVLPILMKHDKPALILNLADAACQGSPYISVYSGAKGFLISWSKSLARELRSERKKVEVLALNVMDVAGTRSKDEGRAAWSVPHRETFVSSVLEYVLGVGGTGELVLEGYWMHGLMARIYDLMPSWYLTKVMTQNMKNEMFIESLKRKKI